MPEEQTKVLCVEKSHELGNKRRDEIAKAVFKARRIHSDFPSLNICVDMFDGALERDFSLYDVLITDMRCDFKDREAPHQPYQENITPKARGAFLAERAKRANSCIITIALTGAYAAHNAFGKMGAVTPKEILGHQEYTLFDKVIYKRENYGDEVVRYLQNRL